jgi:hypothetical protein
LPCNIISVACPAAVPAAAAAAAAHRVGFGGSAVSRGYTFHAAGASPYVIAPATARMQTQLDAPPPPQWYAVPAHHSSNKSQLRCMYSIFTVKLHAKRNSAVAGLDAVLSFVHRQCSMDAEQSSFQQHSLRVHAQQPRASTQSVSTPCSCLPNAESKHLLRVNAQQVPQGVLQLVTCARRPVAACVNEGQHCQTIYTTPTTHSGYTRSRCPRGCCRLTHAHQPSMHLVSCSKVRLHAKHNNSATHSGYTRSRWPRGCCGLTHAHQPSSSAQPLSRSSAASSYRSCASAAASSRCTAATASAAASASASDLIVAAAA